jgi:hypothetical protein
MSNATPTVQFENNSMFGGAGNSIAEVNAPQANVVMHNAILGGDDLHVHDNFGSVIVGGETSSIYSVNKVLGYFNAIIGGDSHYIYNTNPTVTLNANTIIGGEGNTITETNNTNVFFNLIGGGTNNNIYDGTINSIIGGQTNNISNSTQSAIIGGNGNSITGGTGVVILGGGGIGAAASFTTYVQNFNIVTVPGNDDTLTQILARDNSGNIRYRNASSLGGAFTGGTVTGATNFTAGLTANTISATTITAGTYWNGSVNITDPIYQIQSTGAKVFTGLTRVSSTTFSVAPVQGYVVVNSGVNNIITVNYSGTTGTTTPYINTSISTYVLISSASTLVLQSTYPTPQQRRQNIFLGRIAHPDKTTIVTANNTTDFIYSPMSALRDMFTPIPLINENISVTYSASSLAIQTTGGNLWGMGINFTNNAYDPDRVIYVGAAPATFQYRTQTGGTYGNSITLDIAFWDNGGVRTAVTGTVATNQRVYLYPSGQIRIQYGQKQYADLASAVTGLFTESFVTFENNRVNAILIGVISVLSNATNLGNSSQAFFSSVSKFGEILGGTGGLATTTLQQAYQNSPDPAILTNSTNGPLEIRGGTGNNNDLNFTIQNNAGTTTGAWNAGGNLTATTVYATTYQNLPTDITITGGTYSAGTATFRNNTGGTFTVTGFSTSTATSFTGGTVTGATNFTNGLTANTFSAATYQGNVVTQIVAGTNITISPTGGTGSVTVNATSAYDYGTTFAMTAQNFLT